MCVAAAMTVRATTAVEMQHGCRWCGGRRLRFGWDGTRSIGGSGVWFIKL